MGEKITAFRHSLTLDHPHTYFMEITGPHRGQGHRAVRPDASLTQSFAFPQTQLRVLKNARPVFTVTYWLRHRKSSSHPQHRASHFLIIWAKQALGVFPSIVLLALAVNPLHSSLPSPAPATSLLFFPLCFLHLYLTFVSFLFVLTEFPFFDVAFLKPPPNPDE